MPDVAVIIPTFNRLWSLPKAIESCRAIASATEIIVVDDGSTDGTWDWLQSQPHVIALRQDNWGKDWAVNRGFARASAEFVRFLDSDDWLNPVGCDEQVAIARRTGADVVVSGLYLYDDDRAAATELPWAECDDFIAQQLGECSSGHYSSYLMRREFVTDIPHRQEFGARDDRMFVIELACKHPRVAVSSTPSLYHRIHAKPRLQGGDARQVAEANRRLAAVYRKAMTLLEMRGELTPRRVRAATAILWPLAHWLARVDPAEGGDLVALIDRLDPTFRPPEPGLLGWLYRTVGFRATEQLLTVRRTVISFARR